MKTNHLKLFNELHLVLIVLIFGSVLQTATCIAQQSNKLQKQKDLKKMLQVSPNENLQIKHFQENNLLQEMQLPAGKFQFKPNQTYVVQAENLMIDNPDRSLYNKLDKDIRNTYALKDIKILPEVFVQTGAKEGTEMIYRIGFESKLPLEYLFTSEQFEGSMKFFLLSESSSANEQLKKSVLVEVVSDDIKFIHPNSKEIDHVSIPFTSIELKDSDLSDSAQVKIITKSNPKGYETFIEVEPAVKMSLVRKKLQGLGVQEIPVHVRVLGSSVNDSVKVSFNIEKGTIIPNTIYVHYQHPSTVNLRSEGLGQTVLTASSSYSSNELRFRYVFPWIFIGMAILGGFLGGVLKYLTNKEKVPFWNAMLKGIILGFIGAVVYYVLGFSLIKFEVSDIFNEFAVLGFSALVAYFGVQVSGT